MYNIYYTSYQHYFLHDTLKYLDVKNIRYILYIYNIYHIIDIRDSMIYTSPGSLKPLDRIFL